MTRQSRRRTDTSMLSTLWHCLSLKRVATGLLFLSVARAASTYTHESSRTIPDFADLSEAASSDISLRKTLARFSRAALSDFQSSNIEICNKPPRSLALRMGSHSVGSFNPGDHPMPTCESTLLSLRSTNAQELAASLEAMSIQQIHRLPQHCQTEATWAFITTAIMHQSEVDYSQKHNIANCHELAIQVAHRFSQSDDPQLSSQHMVIANLLNPDGATDHVFNIIFPAGRAPSTLQGNMLDLAKQYPHARAIDLWNHIHFELGDLRNPKKFKARFKQSLRYALYTGTKPGGKLSQKDPRLKMNFGDHPQKMKELYSDCAQYKLELLPAKPSHECRP